MRSNTRSGTKPELILSKLLKKPLLTNHLPGSPDFIYPEVRLAVFVQGDWWHRCPVCNIPLPKRHKRYWKRKLERNVERDELNKRELKSMGWKVVQVWEHEIKLDPMAAATRIRHEYRLGLQSNIDF